MGVDSPVNVLLPLGLVPALKFWMELGLLSGLDWSRSLGADLYVG